MNIIPYYTRTLISEISGVFGSEQNDKAIRERSGWGDPNVSVWIRAFDCVCMCVCVYVRPLKSVLHGSICINTLMQSPFCVLRGQLAAEQARCSGWIDALPRNLQLRNTAPSLPVTLLPVNKANYMTMVSKTHFSETESNTSSGSGFYSLRKRVDKCSSWVFVSNHSLFLH